MQYLFLTGLVRLALTAKVIIWTRPSVVGRLLPFCQKPSAKWQLPGRTGRRLAEGWQKVNRYRELGRYGS